MAGLYYAIGADEVYDDQGKEIIMWQLVTVQNCVQQ